MLLLRNLGTLLVFSFNALSYPYSLDYGEGIVWQQMRDMLQGTAYGPLEVYPAIVYHYPPVFHLVAGATAAISGADQLAAGRAVEVVSSFGDRGSHHEPDHAGDWDGSTPLGSEPLAVSLRH